MMKKNLLFVILIASLALASCLKRQEFPIEPLITLEAFEQYGIPDSANLVINFTDGDGNLGLDEGDTTGVFCSTCLYHSNLFCEYYEMQNGQWVHIPLDPEFTPPFWYRVPWLKPTGQDKAQDGKIEVMMRPYFLNSEFDSCRFEVFVVDRDLNESNHIFTPLFLKQY